MKLNVGCGADPWGDVRLDVTKRPPNYFIGNLKPSANLIADAQFLPFKDKCFYELRAFQVLEHLPDWKKALHEWCRVAQKLHITIPVESNTPKLYGWITNFTPSLGYFRYLAVLPKLVKGHLWQFNIKVLVSLIKKFGFSNVRVNLIYYPIFSFLAYGRKARYFRYLAQRFRKPMSWEITAW